MRVISALLLIAWPLSVHAQGAVTKSNWQRHPAIIAIQQLVAAIDRDSARYVQLTDSASCHGGEVSLTATLWSDSTGTSRRYQVAGGSGDSAGEARYYYDASGRLRFVFTETGAVNGTQREDRAFFARNGTLLYKDSRLIRGPGYPGGFAPDPIFGPTEDMAHLCGSDD